MDQLVLVFVLGFATIVAQPLARRIGLPAAVLMTIFGLIMAVLPFVPNIALPPELILPMVLPPLLYASARRTSWQQFASDSSAILLRAVGLVVATAAAVAAIFHLWYPALPLGAAFALGAVVAPPDPVAVGAMADRLGLPRRLVSVLEGEGLFNDVTAVVLYDVAVEAVVTGQFSTLGTLVDFVVSAVVAVAVGLALGWAGSAMMRRLTEAPWQVALGLLLPFAAYGIAEAAHGSAVLAVLVCALYLTDAATDFSNAGYRLVSDSFWDVIELLVTGFAFGLVGLELSTVLATTGPNWTKLLGVAAAVVGVVVGLRLLWLMVATGVFRKWWHRKRVDEPYTYNEAVVTWWAGMRGVVTVALALALPLTTEAGEDFPGRTEVLFVAFVVVLFTLLLQGPTLPLVARWTGVRADTEVERMLEKRLWTRILRAEVERLEDIADNEDLPDEVYQRLRDTVERRLSRADPEAAESGDNAKSVEHAMRMTGQLRRISNEVLEAGRSEAMTARRESDMPPDLVDRVMRRLDLRPPPLL
ncbi:Na+/H+ antiporter [Nocardia vermiculata]|uniref:Na+/H+ antiporter n=1 Tax=Nocardia vermiculata TaxID=257274 RepID=A0A846Y4X1_9NOCA|nr:Na+/H+ antiporter [Nocardia vermiculata]NKY53285.1 Na+/H+ antiporter [Nocardia vermiculata]